MLLAEFAGGHKLSTLAGKKYFGWSRAQCPESFSILICLKWSYPGGANPLKTGSLQKWGFWVLFGLIKKKNMITIGREREGSLEDKTWMTWITKVCCCSQNPYHEMRKVTLVCGLVHDKMYPHSYQNSSRNIFYYSLPCPTVWTKHKPSSEINCERNNDIFSAPTLLF